MGNAERGLWAHPWARGGDGKRHPPEALKEPPQGRWQDPLSALHRSGKILVSHHKAGKGQKLLLEYSFQN